jgi:hypothetical protein
MRNIYFSIVNLCRNTRIDRVNGTIHNEFKHIYIFTTLSLTSKATKLYELIVSIPHQRLPN